VVIQDENAPAERQRGHNYFLDPARLVVNTEHANKFEFLTPEVVRMVRAFDSAMTLPVFAGGQAGVGGHRSISFPTIIPYANALLTISTIRGSIQINVSGGM
jgi:hypothetical protein